jgi:hypothetical protein
MVKKSYDNMIKVKVIPDELMNKVKAMFGIPAKIQQPDSDDKPESKAKRRQLQIVSKEQVKKNQITLGVFLVLLVVAIIVIIVLRRKIWTRLP